MVLESFKNVARALRRAYISFGLPADATFSQCLAEVDATSDFSIIVAIHDSPKVTARCLKSLGLYFPKGQVILVDDGSKLLETKDLITKYVKLYDWDIVINEKSLGHSRACELGAEKANRPFLCFLNSDTYITPWGWEAIKSTFYDRSDVAAIGPSTSWATTEQRIIAAMHCRNYWSDSQIVAFARRYIDQVKNIDCLVELTEINGFAFFIRNELWKEFDGFDPEIKDYGNEAELCIRLKLSGWKLLWNRCAYIHHFGNQSYSMVSDNYINERKKEMAKYIEKKYELSSYK